MQFCLVCPLVPTSWCGYTAHNLNVCKTSSGSTDLARISGRLPKAQEGGDWRAQAPVVS